MMSDRAAQTAPIGIMGGAFDPVHYGHLRTSIELRELLGLAEIRFIPSANPPHRPPHLASSEQRVAMLDAALAGLECCLVDAREIMRDGPSWSVVTLQELRAENPDRSLCMILGMDAFLGLPDWHRWEDLPDLAHIVVACRPGSVLPDEGVIGELLAERGATADDLQQSPSGRIFVHEVTQLEISSSQIRQLIADGQSIDFLVPPEVAAYIAAAEIYLPQNDFEHKEQGIHG